MRLSSQNTGEMKALIERQEMALIRLRNELHIAQEWSARVIAGRDQDTAEITTLRAEIDEAQKRESCALDLSREWEAHCKTAEAQRDSLRAENERLRAALRLFACDCTVNEFCKFPHSCPSYIARAALEGKSE